MIGFFSEFDQRAMMRAFGRMFVPMIVIVVGVSAIAFIGEETGNQLLVDVAYSGIASTMFFLIYVFLSG